MMPKTLRLLVCAGLCAIATSAAALDRVTVEYGNSAGDADINRYGGSLTWDWGVKWLETGTWYLGGYTETGLNYWESDPGSTGNDSLVDGHITGVMRWQRAPGAGIAPFIELGLGAHGHSESGIEDKDFDIGFAFGSHLGGGLRFGENGRYELMYRFQHLSNAGLGEDNPGVNFHLINLGYHF